MGSVQELRKEIIKHSIKGIFKMNKAPLKEASETYNGKRTSLADLFLELAPLNTENKTRWVNTDEFVGKYQRLKFGNGGHWIRKSSCLGKMYNIEKRKKGNKILEIRINGKNVNSCKNRPIGKKIRLQLKGRVCVSCGTSTETEIDHKNGRYNDEKVLNVKTQEVSDFQVLCRHCNLRKREICKRCEDTGERYKATHIYYEEDFSVGDSKHDGTKEGCLGCYWNDIEDFRRTK